MDKFGPRFRIVKQGMKSRPDGLNELDIRCRQLPCSHSLHMCRRALISTMVGATVLTYATVAVLVSAYDMSAAHPIGEIKKSVFNTNGLGSYSFEYETSDGTYRREDGGIKSASEGFAVRGEYAYVDPSGRHHSVLYVADVNGFQPKLYVGDTRFNDRNII